MARGGYARSLYGVVVASAAGVDRMPLGVSEVLPVGVGGAVDPVVCGVVAEGEGSTLAVPVGPAPVVGLPLVAGVEVGADTDGVGVVLGVDVAGSVTTMDRIWFS